MSWKHSDWCTAGKEKEPMCSSAPLEEKPRNNPSFTSVVKEHGMSMTSKLLQASIMQATEHERQQFQLPPDSKIVYIKRLRFVEGNPFLIEMSWYSERFVGLLVHDLEKESVYEILRQEYNVLTLNAKKSIELASITSEEAELLQTSNGSHRYCCCANALQMKPVRLCIIQKN